MSFSKKKEVLFVCTGNSCRSQMAEAIVNARLGTVWRANSAGTHPAEVVNPIALKVLEEIGISHQGVPEHISEYLDTNFDLIVTVCDNAAENCPVWFGEGHRLHLGFPDPALAVGSEDEILAVYRQLRDDIVEQIPALLKEVKTGA